MADKKPIDKITFSGGVCDVKTDFLEGRLDGSYDFQTVPTLGYRIVKDWKERRPVSTFIDDNGESVNLSLGTYEERTKWVVVYLTKDGTLVSTVEMSSDWKVVNDLECLPADYREQNGH